MLRGNRSSREVLSGVVSGFPVVEEEVAEAAEGIHPDSSEAGDDVTGDRCGLAASIAHEERTLSRSSTRRRAWGEHTTLVKLGLTPLAGLA